MKLHLFILALFCSFASNQIVIAQGTNETIVGRSKDKVAEKSQSNLHRVTFRISSDSLGKKVLWSEDQYLLIFDDGPMGALMWSTKVIPDKILNSGEPNFITVIMDDGPIPICPPSRIPKLHDSQILNKVIIVGSSRPGKCCSLDDAYNVGRTITADKGEVEIKAECAAGSRRNEAVHVWGSLKMDAAECVNSSDGIWLNNTSIFGQGILNLRCTGDPDPTLGTPYIGFWYDRTPLLPLNDPSRHDAKTLMAVKWDGKVIIGKNTSEGLTSEVPNASLTIGDPTDNTDFARLRVYGKAIKPGGGTWEDFSDARLKTDVHPFSDGLKVIKAINPVQYKFNGKAKTPTGKTYVGVIAQEVRQVAPYMVSTQRTKLEPGDSEETDLLTFDGSGLIYIALNAIKELDQKVNELQQIRQKYEQISSQLEKLESALGRQTQSLTNATSD